MTYVQTYLKKVGRRKCEANSIVVIPEMGRRLCEKTITRHLGAGALERFRGKRRLVKTRMDRVLEASGAGNHVRKAIELLEDFDQ
jgi:hypothetical protein